MLGLIKHDLLRPADQSYNTFYTLGRCKIKCRNRRFNDKVKRNPTNLLSCSDQTINTNKNLCLHVVHALRYNCKFDLWYKNLYRIGLSLQLLAVSRML